MVYDASAAHPELAAADVIAVPEPSAVTGLLLSGAMLSAVHRFRIKRS